MYSILGSVFVNPREYNEGDRNGGVLRSLIKRDKVQILFELEKQKQKSKQKTKKKNKKTKNKKKKKTRKTKTKNKNK